MKTEDLIVELAGSSGPWTPLASLRVRATRWLLLAFALCGVALIAIGPRKDFLAAIQDPFFVAAAVVLIAVGLIAASAAFVLSVPGAERTSAWRVGAILLAVGWALMFVGRLIAGGDAWTRLAAFPNHWGCVSRITALSLLSGVALYVMLRRAAPLQRAWSSALATLAATGFAAAATHIMCPVDDPAHHIASHVLPVTLLAIVGTVVGRRWLAGRVGS